MYICLCNALKEKQMCDAINGGATTASQVYKKLGCKPQCGKCVEFVREAISANQKSCHA